MVRIHCGARRKSAGPAEGTTRLGPRVLAARSPKLALSTLMSSLRRPRYKASARPCVGVKVKQGVGVSKVSASARCRRQQVYLREKLLLTVTDPPKYGGMRADWNVRTMQPALTPSPLTLATATFCTSPDEA